MSAPVCSYHYCSHLSKVLLLPAVSPLRTYIPNDSGANAAFDLTCAQQGAPSKAFNCPGTSCPDLSLTHPYFDFGAFQADCQAQQRDAGEGQSGRRLAASRPQEVIKNSYLATISKQQTGVDKPQAFITGAGTAKCRERLRACFTLS